MIAVCTALRLTLHFSLICLCEYPFSSKVKVERCLLHSPVTQIILFSQSRNCLISLPFRRAENTATLRKKKKRKVNEKKGVNTAHLGSTSKKCVFLTGGSQLFISTVTKPHKQRYLDTKNYKLRKDAHTCTVFYFLVLSCFTSSAKEQICFFITEHPLRISLVKMYVLIH